MRTIAKTVALYTCRACFALFFHSDLSPDRCPSCGGDRVEKQGHS
jgi:rubrerythrin